MTEKTKTTELTKLMQPHAEAIARLMCKLKSIDPEEEHGWTESGMEGRVQMVKNWEDQLYEVDEMLAKLLGFPGRGTYYAARI